MRKLLSAAITAGARVRPGGRPGRRPGAHIHNGDQFIYQVMAFPRTATGMADTITSP